MSASDKDKPPTKNVVVTRAKGKSKTSADAGNSRVDKSCDSDASVTRTSRTLGRQYMSDAAMGGPDTDRETSCAEPVPQEEPASGLDETLRPERPFEICVNEAQGDAMRSEKDKGYVPSARRVRVDRIIDGLNDAIKEREGIRGKRPRLCPEYSDWAEPDDRHRPRERARGRARSGTPESRRNYQCGYGSERGSIRSVRSVPRKNGGRWISQKEAHEFADLRLLLDEINEARARDESDAEFYELQELTDVTIGHHDMVAEGGRPWNAKVWPVEMPENQPKQQKNQQAARGIQQAKKLSAMGAMMGAPGGGGGGDDGDDSDRDWHRRNRDRHTKDAARRRAARMSDNPDASRAPSQQGRPGTGARNIQAPVPQNSGYIHNNFDVGRTAADAVAVASAALQALAPAKMNLEQINLPKFDGKDFHLFHKQFDSIATEQKWSSETRARKIFECLQGDTRRHVETYMTYEEMLEALRQYYAGSRPSIEAKNSLRNFRKAKDETIEAYASRIQAYADEARLSPFDKLKYMQEAFMSGISYDTKMQRYIEKRTSQNENVHIVKLLKAAQDYQHDKQGSTQSRRNLTYNAHRAVTDGEAAEMSQMSDGGENVPMYNVLKGQRKEVLSHDDANVSAEVDQEHEKLRAERAEKAQARNVGMRKELEATKALVEELKLKVEQQTQARTQSNNGGGQRNGNGNPRGGRGGFRGNWRGRNFGNGGRQFNNNNYNNNNNNNNGNYQGQNHQFPQRTDYSQPPQRQNYGPQYGYGRNYTPSAPLGQTPFQAAPAQGNQQVMTSNDARMNPVAPPAPAPAQQTVPKFSQHAVTATVQTDNMGNIDPNVFPGNNIYAGSNAGNQA